MRDREVRVERVRDVLGGHRSAEVLCANRGEVVRRLEEREGGMVWVDALTESAEFPGNLPVSYEPWVFDRGSLLFDGNKKLATEYDRVIWPDGSGGVLLPANREG